MSNIDVIENFVVFANTDKLIINQVSEEIGIFYKNVICEFCKKEGINLVYGNGTEINETCDLFEHQKITLCFTNNTKIIDSALLKKEKTILITDYKSFKKYSKKLLSVNGYNYDKDIYYYLQNKLEITNLDVLEFCISTPQLFYSEISKFLVNSDGYVKETKIKEKNNLILELRKELFNLKREKSSLKNIYENLKNEAKYKKFNFLAY